MKPHINFDDPFYAMGHVFSSCQDEDKLYNFTGRQSELTVWRKYSGRKFKGAPMIEKYYEMERKWDREKFIFRIEDNNVGDIYLT